MSTSVARRARSVVAAGILAVTVVFVALSVGGAPANATPPPTAAPRTTLAVGATLGPGEVLQAVGYGQTLTMQTDGNLVQRYLPATRALFVSGTDVPGSRLVNQADGNLVIRDPAGHALWSTGTGTAGPLTLVGCGALKHARYIEPCVTPQPLDALVGTNISPDGRTDVTLQTDGNLVLRTSAGGAGRRVLWATYTHGRLSGVAQTDGNLVLRDLTGRAVWASGSAGRGCTTCSTVFQVGDDGNLVLRSVRPGGASVAIWSSGTRN